MAPIALSQRMSRIWLKVAALSTRRSVIEAIPRHVRTRDYPPEFTPRFCGAQLPARNVIVSTLRTESADCW